MIAPEILAKLAESGIELHLLSSGEHHIVVKQPDRATYKRFRSMVADQAKRADAPEALVRDCVVYPDRDGFNALLERHPALGDVFAAKLLDIAGMNSEAEAKKL